MYCLLLNCITSATFSSPFLIPSGPELTADPTHSHSIQLPAGDPRLESGGGGGVRVGTRIYRSLRTGPEFNRWLWLPVSILASQPPLRSHKEQSSREFEDRGGKAGDESGTTPGKGRGDRGRVLGTTRNRSAPKVKHVPRTPRTPRTGHPRSRKQPRSPHLPNLGRTRIPKIPKGAPGRLRSLGLGVSPHLQESGQARRRGVARKERSTQLGHRRGGVGSAERRATKKGGHLCLSEAHPSPSLPLQTPNGAPLTDVPGEVTGCQGTLPTSDPVGDLKVRTHL